MEEDKKDLRIIKTKKAIRTVFLELLKKKPVEKITVTELANAALINKGTFYRHYDDIYSLYTETLQLYIEGFCAELKDYDAFFDAPEAFVRAYLKHSKENSIVEKFPYLHPDNMRFPVPIKMTAELKKHLFETGRIAHSIENEIRLECAVSNIFTALFRYGEDYPQELIQVLGENIRALFPK